MFLSRVRSTLFKLFILPYFDYCSTIFINYGYAANNLKFEACFSKSINRLLKINLNESILTQQYELLKVSASQIEVEAIRVVVLAVVEITKYKIYFLVF